MTPAANPVPPDTLQNMIDTFDMYYNDVLDQGVTADGLANMTDTYNEIYAYYIDVLTTDQVNGFDSKIEAYQTMLHNVQSGLKHDG